MCPSCGTKIMDGELFCSNCGTKVEQPTEELTQPVEQMIEQPVEVQPEEALVDSIQPETETVEVAPVEDVNLEMPAIDLNTETVETTQPEETIQPVVEEKPELDTAGNDNLVSEVEPKEKKPKNKKKAIIIGVILLVLVLGCLGIWFFLQKLSGPSNLTISTITKFTGNVLEMTNLESNEIYKFLQETDNIAVETTLSVNPSDIKGVEDLDLGLNTIELKMLAQEIKSKEMARANLSLSLDDASISMEVLEANNNVYLQIQELMEEYYYTEFGYIGFFYDLKMVNLTTLNKHLEKALKNNIKDDDFEESKDTLTINEKDVKVTKYTLKVDEELIGDIALDFLKEIKKDETFLQEVATMVGDINKIVEELEDSIESIEDLNKDDYYDEDDDYQINTVNPLENFATKEDLVELLDDLIEELEEVDFSSDTLFKFTLYKKGLNDVVGLEVKVDDQKISYVNLDGYHKISLDEYAYLIWEKEKDVYNIKGKVEDGPSVKGTYTAKDKENFTLDLTFSYEEQSIDLELSQAGKKATLTVDLNLEDIEPITVKVDATDISDSAKKVFGTEMKLSLVYNNEELGAFTIKYKLSEGSNINVPSADQSKDAETVTEADLTEIENKLMESEFYKKLEEIATNLSENEDFIEDMEDFAESFDDDYYYDDYYYDYTY